MLKRHWNRNKRYLWTYCLFNKQYEAKANKISRGGFASTAKLRVVVHGCRHGTPDRVRPGQSAQWWEIESANELNKLYVNKLISFKFVDGKMVKFGPNRERMTRV